MLKFIGSGSAFNTKLGNNSAYYKKDRSLLLIDCGSNIFQRIKESNLLEGVEDIHVIVTHAHADHIGSLADLILYSYYSHGEFAQKKIAVYSASNTYADAILSYMGCEEGVHYSEYIVGTEDDLYIKQLDTAFSLFETNHVEEIHSYGVELKIGEVNVLYTGDTNRLSNLLQTLINNERYEYAFVDTCKADYEGNVHLSLRELTELIDPEARKRVYCMHLDESFSREEAEELGFNVVKNEF